MKKNIKEAMIVSPAGQSNSKDLDETLANEEDFDSTFKTSTSEYQEIPHYEINFENTGYNDEGTLYIDPETDSTEIIINKIEEDGSVKEYYLDLSNEEPKLTKVNSLDEKVKSVKKAIQENKKKIRNFKEAVCELDNDQIKNIADDVRFIADDFFSEDQKSFEQLQNAASEIEDYNFDTALDIVSDVADNCSDAEIAESIWDAVAPLRQC